MPDRVAMRQPHYKGEVGPARWYTIVDLETLPVRRDRTHRPVGTWLSLVEHSLGVRGVGSSNLPVPTKTSTQLSAVSQNRSFAKRARDFACGSCSYTNRLRNTPATPRTPEAKSMTLPGSGVVPPLVEPVKVNASEGMVPSTPLS